MTSFIASQTSFQGIIHTHEPLKIQGIVEGKIFSDSSVWIESKGFIKGEIYAKEVIVEGKCEGEITCEHLILKAYSHFKGDVKSTQFSMEAKALFEGKSTLLALDDTDASKKQRKPIAPFDTENVLL